MKKVQDIQVNLNKRLKKIEGQVKGIQRMIEEGKNCQDILTQIAAARSALKMVGNLALSHYAAECLNTTGSSKDKKVKVEELQKLIQTIARYSS